MANSGYYSNAAGLGRSYTANDATMMIPNEDYYYYENGGANNDENRTDVLKLILYDLNSAIAPRDVRLMAIHAAMEEFDHHDETLHDEELELRADHILLQKLTYAMTIDPTSVEVGYICSAMEMVYRAGKGRLANSFHEIGDSLLPVFVEMIRPPPLIENGKGGKKSAAMEEGAEEKKVDLLDEESETMSAAQPFMEEIAVPIIAPNNNMQGNDDDDDESAESVPIPIPSGAGEYFAEMHKMSTANQNDSAIDGTVNQTEGDALANAVTLAPKPVRPMAGNNPAASSGAMVPGGPVAPKTFPNGAPHVEGAARQQQMLMVPHNQQPITPLQGQYQQQPTGSMPQQQGQYQQQPPGSMPQQQGQYQQPPPMPHASTKTNETILNDLKEATQHLSRRNSAASLTSSTGDQLAPVQPNPQSNQRVGNQLVPVQPNLQSNQQLPRQNSTELVLVTPQIQGVQLVPSQQGLITPVHAPGQESTGVVARRLAELTMGDDEDTMRLRGGGRGDSDDDSQALSRSQYSEDLSQSQYSEAHGEGDDQFNEQMPNRSSLFRSNTDFDPSVYEGSNLSSSVYSSENPFSEAGSDYETESFRDSGMFTQSTYGVEESVKSSFRQETSGDDDDLSNLSYSLRRGGEESTVDESDRVRSSVQSSDRAHGALDDGISQLTSSFRQETDVDFSERDEEGEEFNAQDPDGHDQFNEDFLQKSSRRGAGPLDKNEDFHPKASALRSDYDDGVSNLSHSFQGEAEEFDEGDNKDEGIDAQDSEGQSNPFHPGVSEFNEDEGEGEHEVFNAHSHTGNEYVDDNPFSEGASEFNKDEGEHGGFNAQSHTGSEYVNDNRFSEGAAEYEHGGGHVGSDAQPLAGNEYEDVNNAPHHGIGGFDDDDEGNQGEFNTQPPVGNECEDVNNTPHHGIGGFDDDDEDNQGFNTQPLAGNEYEDVNNMPHHGIGGFDDDNEDEQEKFNAQPRADNEYKDVNDMPHHGIGGFEDDNEGNQGEFNAQPLASNEYEDVNNMPHHGIGGFDEYNEVDEEYFNAQPPVGNEYEDANNTFHQGAVEFNEGGQNYEGYDPQAPSGYDGNAPAFNQSGQQEYSERAHTEESGYYAQGHPGEHTANWDGQNGSNMQFHSAMNVANIGGMSGGQYEEKDDGYGYDGTVGSFQQNQYEGHQHSADDINYLESTMYDKEEMRGSNMNNSMNMGNGPFEQGEDNSRENEDIFHFQEPQRELVASDEYYGDDREESIICPLAVRMVLKILRYFSRVLSAMEQLAQQPGLVDALLYQMTKKPHSIDDEEEISRRVDAIAVIVNLACAEENKIMLVYHPGLLDAVINIANFDPIDEAREHAAIVIMNLAYAEENKVHMVNQDQLLDTLIHLLSDVSPFTRRYASAALFTLACTYANTAVMSRHCDGGILEALRKVLLNDPIDEARVNAAEALFNMARNNADDTVENMGNHPKLLASLAHSVLTDYSADVRAYSARALEWLSADIHHPMSCHLSLLKALTTASQWTKTTCIAEALKMQASLSENRKPMAEHDGLLDALATLALLDGINDDELRTCAISSLERLTKEASTRHLMVKNEGVMTALTKATFSKGVHDDDDDDDDEKTPASLLMKTALKNLAEHL